MIYKFPDARKQNTFVRSVKFTAYKENTCLLLPAVEVIQLVSSYSACVLRCGVTCTEFNSKVSYHILQEAAKLLLNISEYVQNSNVMNAMLDNIDQISHTLASQA